MKKLLTLILMVTISFAAFAEGQQDMMTQNNSSAQMPAKYVFLFIGDGMAIPQINAAEAYLASGNAVPGIENLSFTSFPSSGLTTTYSSNAFITDSAAAGTAIACGQKTESGVISMDETKSEVLPTIAEMAHEAGMKVGILSSVNLDHATPAVFYAHNQSRNNYYDINIQMANSPYDYFAGGMVRTSKTPEGQPTAHEVMEDNGFTIVNNREDLQALRNGVGPVYAYNEGFAFNALDYTMDQDQDDITLAEFTAKGIELLDNPNGFFMMVEAGKIDWACHANDAAASIMDTVAFSESVQEAIDFYIAHPDETLIIVTGDHETGGLTLGFAGTKYESAFSELGKQTMSYEAFNTYLLNPYREANPNGSLEDVLPVIAENFGLTDLSDYERELLEDSFARSMKGEEEISNASQDYLLYGGYEPFTVSLTHVLNQRAGIAWTSYSHTGVPVQTFALGNASELFNGYYDNTDIFHKMVSAMGL